MVRKKAKKARPERKSSARKKSFIRSTIFACLIILGIFLGTGAAQIKYWITIKSELNDLIGITSEHTPELGSEIPLIEISLADTTIEGIDTGPKETKYGGSTLSLTVPENYFEDSSLNINSVFSDVEIKSRGNGTRTQEKKAYQIKFKDKVDFLGLGKARKWIFLANAFDSSNVRTNVVLGIMQKLNSKFAFQGKFAELIIDGNYRGLYYITPKTEIGKTSIDLREPTGILMELDNLYGKEDCIVADRGDCLIVKDIVNDELQEEAVDNFMTSFNLLGQATSLRDYETISKIIDTESLVNYLLLSEFVANPDAYWTSFFFYKDGPDDIIHLGPGWDFDLTLGNQNWIGHGDGWNKPQQIHFKKLELYVNGGDFYDETFRNVNCHEPLNIVPSIISELQEMPEIKNAIKNTYQNNLKNTLLDILEYIDQDAEKIKIPALRNAERWDYASPDESIAYLKWWLEEKVRFLDRYFEDKIIFI